MDNAGTATLTLSLTSMYQQRTTPSGDVLIYDSANPDKSDPHLKKALEGYLEHAAGHAPRRRHGQGRRGQGVEVARQRSTRTNCRSWRCCRPRRSRPGLAWQREYKITLSPPLGTGEKYDAVQKYACKSVDGRRWRR